MVTQAQNPTETGVNNGVVACVHVTETIIGGVNIGVMACVHTCVCVCVCVYRLAKIKEWVDTRDPHALLIPFSAGLELKVKSQLFPAM